MHLIPPSHWAPASLTHFQSFKLFWAPGPFPLLPLLPRPHFWAIHSAPSVLLPNFPWPPGSDPLSPRPPTLFSITVFIGSIYHCQRCSCLHLLWSVCSTRTEQGSANSSVKESKYLRFYGSVAATQHCHYSMKTALNTEMNRYGCVQ